MKRHPVRRVVRRLLLIGLLMSAFAASWPPHLANAKPPGGVAVSIADQVVALKQPLLDGVASTEDQQKVIADNLRGLPYNQFARDSIVAPVRIDLDYVKDDQGNRVGHQVHLLFIVHAPLSAFSSDGFAEQILGETEAEDTKESFRSESPGESTLQRLGIDPTESNQHYRRWTFDLLDKIRLSGLFRIATENTETQNRVDVMLVDEADNRWERLDRSADSGAYSGFRGWITATELATGDAVLVEARFAFHEPPQWFRGSNYLRSKLPLVLQNAARDLRRRLTRD